MLEQNRSSKNAAGFSLQAGSFLEPTVHQFGNQQRNDGRTVLKFHRLSRRSFRRASSTPERLHTRGILRNKIRGAQWLPAVPATPLQPRQPSIPIFRRGSHSRYEPGYGKSAICDDNRLSIPYTIDRGAKLVLRLSYCSFSHIAT
jgi:hypothetical protein